MSISLDVSKTIFFKPALSEKSRAAAGLFGLSIERLRKRAVTHQCKIELEDGDIVYITGPSGSGKSVLLAELQKAIPASQRINLSEIELRRDRAVLDCIDGDFLTSHRLLSTAGLSGCFSVLNRPGSLSTGEQYRFRLAMALASGRKFVFADEFCSELGRITAAVVAIRLRDYAKRHGTIFILASAHEDILMDLAPDVLIVKDLLGKTEVIYKNNKIRNSK